MTKEEENRFIEGIKAGDRKAEEELFEYFYGVVYGKAFKNIGIKEDAEELAMTVLTAFLENIKKGKFRRESSLATYLFRIFDYKYMDYLRMIENKPTFISIDDESLAEMFSNEPDELEQMIKNSKDDFLRYNLSVAVMKIKKEDIRKVMIMVLSGLESGDIIKLLGGIPPRTIYNYVSRGKEYLLHNLASLLGVPENWDEVLEALSRGKN